MGSQENATNRGDTRLSSNYQMLPIIPTVNSYDEIEARKRERLHERVCLVEKRHPGLSVCWHSRSFCRSSNHMTAIECSWPTELCRSAARFNR